MPLLSVIIPYYNGREYISQCVESLRVISVPKEILVVDDGSEESQASYCRELFAKDADVRVLRKKNGGVIDARNFGIENAQGEYLLFVDQDDTAVAETVSAAVTRAKDLGAPMVVWSTEHLYAGGRTAPCDTVKAAGLVDRSGIVEDLIPFMLHEKESRYVSHLGHIWACAVRRDTVLRHKIVFRSFHSFEDDFLFVYDLFNVIDSVLCVREVGYYWYENAVSTSRQHKRIADYLDNVERLELYLYSRYRELVPEERAIAFLHHAKQRILVHAVKHAVSSTPKCRGDLEKIRSKRSQSDYREAMRDTRAVMNTKMEYYLLSCIRRGFVTWAYLCYFLYRKLK